MQDNDIHEVINILQEAIKEGRRALDARAERRMRGAADDGEAR